MSSALGWRRIQAGLYERTDKQVRIVRAEYDRPNRGVFSLWEIMRSHGGTWAITGSLPSYTLRDAKREAEEVPSV